MRLPVVSRVLGVLGVCLATFLMAGGVIGKWLLLTGLIAGLFAVVGLIRRRLPLLGMDGVGPPRALLTISVLAFLGGVGILEPSSTSRPDPAVGVEPASAPTPSPPVPSPLELLEKGKRAVAASYHLTDYPSPWTLFWEARGALRRIEPSDPLYAEAQRVMHELDEREVEVQKAAAEEEASRLEPERLAYGEQLEEEYLKGGLDVFVRVTGPRLTTIRLTYVLMSRPMAYQLTHNGAFMSLLRAKGFRQLILTDGCGATWDYDL